MEASSHTNPPLMWMRGRTCAITIDLIEDLMFSGVSCAVQLMCNMVFDACCTHESLRRGAEAALRLMQRQCRRPQSSSSSHSSNASSSGITLSSAESLIIVTDRSVIGSSVWLKVW